MRERILAAVGIETGEDSIVSILLTQSVFLGIFFGAFDISAHSLFLSIFDEKMMARAYIISGLVGIFMTVIYTTLQTRMKFKVFATLNLTTIAVISFVLWLILIFVQKEWAIFLVFILLGPLNILAALGFWGTTGRLFSLRQGKRLFGLIDSGLVIGIIVSCYTIPVLLTFNFASHNILFISALSIMIAAAIQAFIGSKFVFSTSREEIETETDKRESSALHAFKSDRYTKIMGVFVAFSVISAFFIQYSFMAVTRLQYPTEADMARFLGLFTGSMMIFTLLMKLFVFSYLIRNYGLKVCLILSPILVVVFTVGAIIVGATMGYTPEAETGFLIFFMLLALGRLFSKSLKDSIESPSFKVIYQTIDEKVRYNIQSSLDGTINEIAALFSGFILAGMGILSFIKLIHFSWVLFAFLIIWAGIAAMLYVEYRKSIRKALEKESRIFDGENDDYSLDNRFMAEKLFKDNYFSIVSGDYNFARYNHDSWLIKKTIDYASSKNNNITFIPILKKINDSNYIDEESKRLAGDLLEKLEQVNAKSSKDKIIAAGKTLIEGTNAPETAEVLRLLRDTSIEAKKLGIFLIGKFRMRDMIHEVCDCLSFKALKAYAYSVLDAFGSDAGKDLERFFLASAGNFNTSIIVLRLIGNLKTKESKAFLFSRLWANSRQIREIAVKLLVDNDFKPTDEEKDKLHQIISETIGVIVWNLAAQICIEKNDDKSLRDVIIAEINRQTEYLFDILSITYDKSSIEKIRENIESGTIETTNYALEMIDIVIDDTIKQKLIMLVDTVSNEVKLKNLYQFYPIEIPRYGTLVEDIINRDYNLMGIWTKACTLRNVKGNESGTIMLSTTALTFSPAEILREESVRVIANGGHELYRAVSDRIPELLRPKLDKIATGEVIQAELFFERAMFLRQKFSSIDEDKLLTLCANLKYYEDLTTLCSDNLENVIIWPYFGGNAKGVIMHYEGRLNEEELNSNRNFRNQSFYALSMAAVYDFAFYYPESSVDIFKNIKN